MNGEGTIISGLWHSKKQTFWVKTKTPKREGFGVFNKNI
jgi:hypothetical protein